LDKIYLFFKKLFTFSYSEARGFAWLLIVSVILMFFLIFPEVVFNQQSDIDPSDIRYLDSMSALLEKKPPRDHFLFDPNEVSKDSLLLLGIPEQVAQRLINYRTSGGRFKIKKDVQKVYGVTEELIESLYAFINLPDSLPEEKNNIKELKFDINIAAVEHLKKVNMIGDVLAMRIVKYRELLGGFIGEEQFAEIYGLSDNAVENLKMSTYIETGFSPRRLKVNHDEQEMLKRHPYISDQLAEDIVRYREINSTIDSEKVLANFKSIDKSNFEKLILYLDFQ